MLLTPLVTGDHDESCFPSGEASVECKVSSCM